LITLLTGCGVFEVWGRHSRRHTRRPVDDDVELIAGLRAGDEHSFVVLVARHQASMLRLASSFVPNRAVAEEVVQDTWVAVLQGIGSFEGRSSFKTWIMKILVNRARSAGAREHRSVAISDAGPAVDRSRFDATGHWASPPEHWGDVDDRLRASDLAVPIRCALDALPSRQREVVVLRDVEGLTSREVRDVLDITESNQRVLLHRGRSRLRHALETEFGMP
jgi:RNA polymerase sigma-70 factor (ECF subfamily)